MKLTIVRLTQFTAQDRIDLSKIWPQQDLNALEAQLSDVFCLYAARFNDRLLAAVMLETHRESGQLRQLVVREVTRRRGVGHYLLQEVLAQHPAVSHWQIASDGVEDYAAACGFMQHSGFRAQSGGWIFHR